MRLFSNRPIVSILGALFLVYGCAGGDDAAPAPVTDGGDIDRAPVVIDPVVVDETTETMLNRVGDRVLFGFDEFSLDARARQVLSGQAELLRSRPNTRIMIEGHCDERGTREYNLALGERRANATRNYLVALGVDGGRIEIISYGKERPDVVGSNERAWQANRRAVTVIN